jgi:hypothetical protein
MPGVYREKNCKYCDKLFRKKGIYCSQSCSSFDKTPTETQRKNMRKVAMEYNRTPEAIAKQKQLNTSLASITVEDFAVDIPTLDPDLSDYNDYNKAEDW